MPGHIEKCAQKLQKTILAVQYLKGIGDSFGNEQRVLETILAKLRAWWIHVGKCPNKSKDPMAIFPTGSPARRKQDYLGPSPIVSPHVSDVFCLFSQSTAVY